jgi:glyoxylase-like metal-dependent hydrolase (beta-lactamase superfamily II)/ferredoxin
MANRAKQVPQNVPGEYFVDSTCIDCDTCRQLAPEVFAETDETAYVHAQPQSTASRCRALYALVSCPTGSIGCDGPDDPKTVLDDFPLAVDGPVFYCGFNSPKSFGGNSYFVRRAQGNWLIDSPKFLARLARRLEALGGVDRIFLTHRDDVADAQRYASHFGSRRLIHCRELSAQPDAEIVLEGDEPREVAAGIVAIPTPGHTPGHCVLVVDDRYLFTGDHLAWDRHARRLTAFLDYCWHSWPQQIESMRRLAEHRFEWVLPGHGQRVQLPADEMHEQMVALVERMERAS